jgi:Tfp pilus assembly protein PilF
LDDIGPTLAAARKYAGARPGSADAVKTLGAVLFRAGRFEEAADRLEAALRIPRVDPAHATYARFLLAMTRVRQGDVAAARAPFAEAARWTDAATATPEARAAAGLTWNRAATLDLLRREAAALLVPVEAPAVR